ncbi:uncharacterized protein N7459_009349 [Penicillium hispanicum]|uniref:uncharacterized protein n=1 Tax=Penicillium hispanicum TaxID=1080232 RepID=UPI00254094FC|nr:uncharacterized protein N7459_009349 [Penicillium hispanicum]KAJ5569919.1 hypothetical protein N7459_009349 [Penicillium hispanicum]
MGHEDDRTRFTSQDSRLAVTEASAGSCKTLMPSGKGRIEDSAPVDSILQDSGAVSSVLAPVWDRNEKVVFQRGMTQPASSWHASLAGKKTHLPAINGAGASASRM